GLTAQLSSLLCAKRFCSRQNELEDCEDWETQTGSGWPSSTLRQFLRASRHVSVSRTHRILAALFESTIRIYGDSESMETSDQRKGRASFLTLTPVSASRVINIANNGGANRLTRSSSS